MFYIYTLFYSQCEKLEEVIFWKSVLSVRRPWKDKGYTKWINTDDNMIGKDSGQVPVIIWSWQDPDITMGKIHCLRVHSQGTDKFILFLGNQCKFSSLFRREWRFSGGLNLIFWDMLYMKIPFFASLVDSILTTPLNKPPPPFQSEGHA